MKELDLTSAQRISFQDRLPDRVRKRDHAWKLGDNKYEKGYLYASVDFGLLLTKPNRTKIMETYVEVADNAGHRVPLLFFSRPRNPIYVAFPGSLVDSVYPIIYIQSDVLQSIVAVSALEQFLQEVPASYG